MALSLAFGPRLAWGKRGQHRQTPNTARKRHLHQPHSTQPAQATASRLGHVGTQARVVEASGCADARITGTFERMVKTNNDWPSRHKGRHDLVQEGAGQREARPGIAVEHTVEGGEARMLGQAQGL